MKEEIENSMCHDITSETFDNEYNSYLYENYKKEKNEKLKDLLEAIIILAFFIIYTIMFVNHIKEQNNDKEYIKQLEQSLNEQIQEVEVYKSMLEEK